MKRARTGWRGYSQVASWDDGKKREKLTFGYTRSSHTQRGKKQCGTGFRNLSIAFLKACQPDGRPFDAKAPSGAVSLNLVPGQPRISKARPMAQCAPGPFDSVFNAAR